ncbi:MAG: hypothetical protein ACXAC6_11080 [Candidatus Hodarchaeales archaeon]|jgi:hypothetical protein
MSDTTVDGILKPIGGRIGISHHWVGKGIVVIFLFIVLGLLFSSTSINNIVVERFSLNNIKPGNWILLSNIIGILIIGPFSAWEAFLL